MTHNCVGLLHVRLHEWGSAIYKGVSGYNVRFPPKLDSPDFSRSLAFLFDEVSKIACNVLCHDVRRAEKLTVSHGTLTRSTRDVNYPIKEGDAPRQVKRPCLMTLILSTNTGGYSANFFLNPHPPNF